jgi:hypothetical protein
VDGESRGRPGAPLPGLKVRRSRPLLHQCVRGAAAIFDARAVPIERGGSILEILFAIRAIQGALRVHSRFSGFQNQANETKEAADRGGLASYEERGKRSD